MDPKCGGSVSWLGCGADLHWERESERDPTVAIRCLDCGSVLCPACARRHFDSDEKSKRIGAMLKVMREAQASLINSADILAVAATFEQLLPDAKAEIVRWERDCRLVHLHVTEAIGDESRIAPIEKKAGGQ